MKKNIQFKGIDSFYDFLHEVLPTSSSKDRKEWAITLTEHQFDVKDLVKLLYCEKKVATRFLWFLSELGELNPYKLTCILPYLLQNYPRYKTINPESSLAYYWLLVGVPIENEAQVIGLLFSWIESPLYNVTTKSRSIQIMVRMIKKYPDLKHELNLHLEYLIDKHTPDFTKKVKKTLEILNSKHID